MPTLSVFCVDLGQVACSASTWLRRKVQLFIFRGLLYTRQTSEVSCLPHRHIQAVQENPSVGLVPGHSGSSVLTVPGLQSAGQTLDSVVLTPLVIILLFRPLLPCLTSLTKLQPTMNTAPEYVALPVEKWSPESFPRMSGL